MLFLVLSFIDHIIWSDKVFRTCYNDGMAATTPNSKAHVCTVMCNKRQKKHFLCTKNRTDFQNDLIRTLDIIVNLENYPYDRGERKPSVSIKSKP